MAKRPQSSPKTPKQEELSPTKISVPTSKATVSGLVSSLSPIKPSKYFEGELTDGDSIVRLVGFDKSKLAKLQPFCDYSLPVTLKDCCIQRNKYKDTLEIVLKRNTTIEESTTEFEIPDLTTAGSTVVHLSDIPILPVHKRVTVSAKVTKIHKSQKFGENKVKQDLTIADATGKATLTLWNQDIGVFTEHTSYKFNRLQVRSYMGKTYLSYPSVMSFSEVAPISVDETNDSPSSDEDEDLVQASIVGVKDLETMYSCINCNKTVTPDDSEVGTCETCKTMQKLISKQTAKLTIKSGTTKVTVRAYDEALREIAQKSGAELTAQDLLFPPVFTCSYNKFHVLKSVSRP